MKYILITFLLVTGMLFADTTANSSAEDSLSIGLVLSGGGAKGFAHIGVLKVIDELGINVEYISGTSMGSILGALYAIGYTPDELEELAKSIDWNSFLLDKIPRTALSMEEKDLEKRYALTFPMKNNKPVLPSGLVSGQNFSNLLARLTLSVHHLENFDDFPIPFRCVATDIERGEAVVFDSGYLPDAIRASMSIPTMFKPIELNGKLLVDGGLVRNFPVSDCIEMGADFVIGVDVARTFKTKDQLQTLVNIVEQSIGLNGAFSTLEQRKLVDLLIQPDTEAYSITDFEYIDSLIAIGEETARKQISELLKVKERQKQKKEMFYPIKTVDSLYVVKTEVKGLDKLSKNIIIGMHGIIENKWMKEEDLSMLVDRLYGSGYFERVTYEFKPVNNGIHLVLRVVEKNVNSFRVGIHYNTDMKSSVLLNRTYKNVLIESSKLTFDGRLSENYGFESQYFVHTGWKPGFGLKAKFWMNKLDVNIRDSSYAISANFKYKQFAGSIGLQTTFTNEFVIGGDIIYERVELSPNFIKPSWYQGSEYSQYLDFKLFMLMDNLDRTFYPRSGVKLHLEYMQSHNRIVDDNREKPVNHYFLHYREVMSIGDFTGTGDLWFASRDRNEITGDRQVYIGGEYYQGVLNLPLWGFSFMEKTVANGIVMQSSIQYEPVENLIFMIKGNGCKIGDSYRDIFRSKGKDVYGKAYGILWGGGVSVGYISPIGPIEVSLYGNSERDDLTTFVSIGCPMIF